MSDLKSDYSYRLPEHLIAKQPASPRDSSRMLILSRRRGDMKHDNFIRFPKFLEDGSVLVVNNSRVIPARLPGKRATGAAIEALLVKEERPGLWRCKVKNSSRIKRGERLEFCRGRLEAEMEEKSSSGSCLLRFNIKEDFFAFLEKFAGAPLPPYIQKSRGPEDARERDLKNYQTIFAKDYGSIAAPTAGLHFSEKILREIRGRGIKILEITLQVGLGTFEPIRSELVSRHKMHEEKYYISPSVAAEINKAKKEKRKITVAGTTCVRALESAWLEGKIRAGHRRTNIFIYPPHVFHAADQLLTNFHLPESTLLMMVSAFAGKDFIMSAYREAVKREYRFYSYGDCMLIQ